MSDEAKRIKEQGNVEAFGLLELRDKVQCEHCHKYMTSGNVHWQCGAADLLTTSGFVLRKGTGRWQKLWKLARATSASKSE